jgi:hypothetical protein
MSASDAASERQASGRRAMFQAIIFTMATPPKDHQKTTPSR